MIMGIPHKSSRWAVLAAATGLLSWAPSCRCPGPSSSQAPSQAPDPDAPSFLLVTLDTVRADALGCYGHARKPTPHLDALAAQGWRFDRAYTVTPLTIPAHSSLFTGLYPPRHGVRDNGDAFLAPAARTLAESFQEGGYATMAAVGAEVTSHHWGFDQGFDAFYDDMSDSRQEQSNRWRVERPGDEVVDDALGWLAGRDRGAGPWFAWVHLFDAHTPYEPRPEYAAQYPGMPYLGEVGFVDEQVGRLVDAVRARGEPTWLVVVADHGEGLGSHGESMHGVLVYDATTRVPLVVVPPDPLAGERTVVAPVSLVDLGPTLLDLAHLPVPEGLDGRSLVPLLDEQPPPAWAQGRELYVESLHAWYHYGWAPQHALVDAGYKLVDSTTPELYRVGDLDEQHDLAAEQPQRVARMQQRLERRMEAMDPQEEAAGTARLSAERMAQLESLGYLVPTNTEAPSSTEALPDPVDRLPVLRWLELARAAVQGGDWDHAHKVVGDLLEREPGMRELHVLMARIEHRTGHVDLAVDRLQSVLAQHESSQAHALLGALLVQQGQPEVARIHLQRAVELDPYLGSAWALRLRLLFQKGDLAALSEALEEARRHVPDIPEVLAMEGLLTAVQGDPDLAVPLLEQALDLRPTLPFANQGLAVVARSRGQDERAESHLLEEVRLYPGNHAARRTLVELYAEQKRYREQVEQLRVLLQAHPQDAQTWHSLAQALYNREQYAEALDAVVQCRELAPRYPACPMLEANVLHRLGQEDRAWEAYRRALALGEQAAGVELRGRRPEPDGAGKPPTSPGSP